MKVLLLTVTSLLVSACASLPLERPATPQSDWERTLGYARRDVDSANYYAAQRILDEFVRTHPGTREAKEIEFWRAVYTLDPANTSGSLGAGITALDAYLATDTTGWYRPEAVVLRRTALVAQGVQTGGSKMDSVAARPLPDTRDTVVVVSRSRDEEIASLKDQLAKSRDELAKAQAELDRIKKRLANPTK